MLQRFNKDVTNEETKKDGKINIVRKSLNINFVSNFQSLCNEKDNLLNVFIILFIKYVINILQRVQCNSIIKKNRIMKYFQSSKKIVRYLLLTIKN